MDSFYGRCFNEKGSDFFRKRCSLCCENEMDDDESESKKAMNNKSSLKEDIW